MSCFYKRRFHPHTDQGKVTPFSFSLAVFFKDHISPKLDLSVTAHPLSSKAVLHIGYYPSHFIQLNTCNVCMLWVSQMVKGSLSVSFSHVQNDLQCPRKIDTCPCFNDVATYTQRSYSHAFCNFLWSFLLVVIESRPAYVSWKYLRSLRKKKMRGSIKVN